MNARYNSVISSRNIVRFAGIALIISLAAGITYFHLYRTSQPVKAAAPLTFSLYATHPYASHAGFDNTSKNYYTNQFLCPPPQTFCPQGQAITDMGITSDGKLIAGYGEWNVNVDSFGVAAGRVGIVPLDLSNGTWGSMFYAGSEAIESIREINGKIYAATTDPSDKAATGNPEGNYSGYITNETGPWTFVRNGTPGNEHTFDVATLTGTDRYTSGARTMASAESSNIRKSTDGGVTWADSKNGNDTSGWGRSHWLANLNGRLYGQKSLRDGGGAVSYDGTAWRDESGVTSCFNGTNTAHLVLPFDGKLVCGDSGLYVFDGTATSVLFNGVQVRDLYVYNGFLYVLTDNGIYRTSSLSSPFEVFSGATIPNDAHSIAAYGDTLYLGGDGGKIYKASLTIAASQITPPSPASCFIFNSTTGTITGYGGPGCTTNIVIPQQINGVDVVAIGAYAFANKNITSLTMPGTIVTIGDNAFSSNQIASLTIPSSVTTIGNAAFYQNQISSLTIPQTVMNLGYGAFIYNSLTDLTVNMQSIPANAFGGGGNHIVNLTLGPSVTTIGNDAFSLNQITTLAMPNSVTSIGAGSFSGNQISSLTLSDALTSIPVTAFAGNKLTAISFPSSVTSIGASAFSGNLLTSLTIPDGITSIGNSAFQGNQIAALSFPDSPVSLGIAVFMANKLTTVTIPSYLASIPSNSFANNQLVVVAIPNSVTGIGDGAFSGNQIASLSIPNSVTSIGVEAFRGNKLTSLTLPGLLTSIGAYAFRDNQLNSLTIPRSTATVGDFAFFGNNITSLTVLGATTTMGLYVFIGSDYQYHIKELYVDSETIPANNPYGTSLTKIELGPHVKNIGASAFANTAITEITIPASVNSIGNSAFAYAPIKVAYINTNVIPDPSVFNFMGVNPMAAFYAQFEACVSAMSPPPQALSDYIPCYNLSTSSSSTFARIYTPYPQNYQNAVAPAVEETLYSGVLGVPPAKLYGGGVLVNPVAVTTTYRTTNGTAVASSSTKVGPSLTDYSIASAVALKPDLTDADLATLYYHDGDSLMIAPPAVNGYQTPAVFSGTLRAPTTSIDFLYAPLASNTTQTTQASKPRVSVSKAITFDGPVGTADTPTEQAIKPSDTQPTSKEAKQHLESLLKPQDKSFGTVLGEWTAAHVPIIAAGGVVVAAPACWWFIGAIRRRNNKES